MEDRAKYFNISYVKQSLSPVDVDYKYNSSLGVAITNGRTYYLHKKPILGMIKFGIDWSFFDVNVAMYENEFTDGYEVEKENMYQATMILQLLQVSKHTKKLMTRVFFTPHTTHTNLQKF